MLGNCSFCGRVIPPKQISLKQTLEEHCQPALHKTLWDKTRLKVAWAELLHLECPTSPTSLPFYGES